MLKWKVPVSIITGYLGVGKTTLLKKIIKDTDKKIAILMNEFGEIGIDTKTIRGENIDIKELLGGCVCCSLTGELSAAIGEILKKVKPEMIVIETTGVAEPGSLIVNMKRIKGVTLDSVVTVVDADSFLNFPSLGHTGRVQIENADIIILNKMDLVKSDKIREIEHALRKLNPNATIIKATYANVDTKILFGLGIERTTKKHEKHDVSQIDSFVYKSDRVHNRSVFFRFVSKIPKEIYRAKGNIKCPDGTYLFNFVNGRHEISKTREGTTELIFIGVGARKSKDSILKDLERCQM